MSSTEQIPDSPTSLAKETARRILQNSINEAATVTQNLDRPLRSESPEARTVPADVQRRTNRQTNAEAPPSTSKQNPRAKKGADKGKGRQEKGVGDSDDSDSDEHRRKTKKQGGSVVKKRSSILEVGNGGPSHKKYPGLSDEEQRAMQLRRAITAMDQRWAALEKHDQECWLRSEMRRPILIAMTHLQCDSLMLSEESRIELSKLEKYKEEYQKAAFFSHIVDQGMQGDGRDKVVADSSHSSLDHVEEVLLSVEDAFIQRCSKFLPRDHILYSKRTRILLMMRRMKEELLEDWDKYTDEGQEEREVLAKFVARHCPTGETFDLLVEQYTRIMLEDLVEEVVTERTNLQDLTKYTMLQRLRNSRNVEDELTFEYVSWAISALDQTELVKRCKDWSRDQAIKYFRSVYKNCTQRFVEDVDPYRSENTVSLVLLKGYKPVNIQPVAIEDLRRMGWYCQQGGGGGGFWRYQRRSVKVSSAWQKYLAMDHRLTGGETQFDVILKIGIDGEVIGIFTPNGVIEWNEAWNKIAEGFSRFETTELSGVTFFGKSPMYN